ncbi:MAG: thermonuclease family protein [Rickettsiales bacterium]
MKRKKYHKYILLTTILFSQKNIYAKQDSCMQELDNFKCLEFVDNYDGDTVTFNIPNIHPVFGQKLNISLIDVKAPTTYSRNKCEKKLAKETKILVRNIFKNAKFIEAKNIVRDKKFGLKGNIFVDGKNLSEKLLDKKRAVPIKDYKNTNWCKTG